MDNKNYVYIAIVGAVVVISGFFAFGRSGRSDGALDEFARCLADKKITMYGVDWCSHCQNEKKAFGESFSLVPYVECPDDPKRCLAAGIVGYPTWVFPDGRKLEGEQGIEKLSRESGCTLSPSK